MNSIKELKEQLGYEEIGLDDIFVFHCTQCGKCCIHREDILLSPKDLFHIAKKLKITPEVALAQYCETYLGRNSHIPVVRLKPQGSVKRCPLLKNQKCLVHDVKPAVCAMFPIGRYLALPSDGIFPENPEELSVGYVFNDPECGDRSETHTVREWFHKFNIPLKDDYFFAWTKTKATLSKHLRFLEGRLSEKTMVSIWNATLISCFIDKLLPMISSAPMHSTIISPIPPIKTFIADCKFSVLKKFPPCIVSHRNLFPTRLPSQFRSHP